MSPRARRLLHPSMLLWAGGLLASMIVVLGVNGSFASWTSASITNDANTISTGQAVVLKELQGTAECLSSQSPNNHYSSCATIDAYGGSGTPLMPGDSHDDTLTFQNVGTADAAGFSLETGACSQSPTAGSGTPPRPNLCTNGDLTIAVACSAGPTFASADAWSDLKITAAAPPGTATTASHTAIGGDLAANATWTCQVTVALDNSTSISAQGITVTQPVTWTLTQ